MAVNETLNFRRATHNIGWGKKNLNDESNKKWKRQDLHTHTHSDVWQQTKRARQK